MSKLIPFNFDQSNIRVEDDGGQVWFVAADVCSVLELDRSAVRRLDADEKGVRLIHTLGGTQNIAVINESGLYTLVMRCRGSATPGTLAHRFRKWVTSEVLPTLRKTGSYGQPDPMVVLSDPAALRGLLANYSEKVLTLETTVATLAPKGEALDRIASADGSLCITEAAKCLQMRPRDLFRWMNAHAWIYRRAGGSGWVAYQPRIQSGLLEHKVNTVERSDGTEKMTEQVRVTPKGLAKLSELLALKVA